MTLRACIFVAAAVLHTAPRAQAQLPPLETPDVSPRAGVSQTVGLTEMTIDYHRPGVNGRPVWDALVPFGEVWRAGANENTTFEVSSDVAVEGRPLPAGRYGLHMIPTAGTWTVIFSEMADAWGSFSYDESEDALRVTVSPRPAPFQEHLIYRFDDPTNTSTEVVLHWEELEIPFTVTVNTPEVVLAHMEHELRGVDQFFWPGWNQIAGYALQTRTRMEDAIGWADRSIAINRNGANVGTKMALLAALGRDAEADALEADFYAIATEADVNTYGYLLLGAGRTEDAVIVFRKNVEDYPESWNVYDSLGEALAAAGQTAEAIEQYERARRMASPAQHARIDGILDSLRGAN